MGDKLTSKGSVAALALLVAAGVGYAAIPAGAASAAPTSETGGDYRPSEWAKASDAASPGKTPSFTNYVG